MKTARVALIALCLLLLVLPSVAMPFFPSGETDAYGQYLADAPALTDGEGALNPAFDTEFEAWLCDRFAFRTWVLRANALINYRLLRTSPNERVVVGGDDWLYYADTVPDYTGEGRLGDDELEAMAANLAVLSEALARRGARLYVTVIPNKNTVYPEHMPRRYAMRGDGGNIQRLREACSKLPLTWIDLTGPLLEAAGGALPVYYRTDTHWNALGAAIAAKAVLQAMGRDAMDYRVDGETDFCDGDLARLMGAPGAIGESVPAVEPAAQLPEADYTERHLRMEGQGTGALLVYRDSFGTAIGPWLARAYGVTELRWEAPLDGTRPCDDALILICERNLREYLGEPPLMDDGAADELPPDPDSFTDINEDDDFFTDDEIPDPDSFTDIDADDDFFTDDEIPDPYSFTDIEEDDDFFTDDDADASKGGETGRADDGI